MWREHVIIDDDELSGARAIREQALEPMLKKAAAMALAYAIGASVLLSALVYFDVSSRGGRGWIVMALLWTCHLDSASWSARARFAKSTRWGRALMAIRSFARERTYLITCVALAPLAFGLMATDWDKLPSALHAVSKVGVASLMWVDGWAVVCAWGAMIEPSALARLEASGPTKGARAVKAARASALPLAVSMMAWGMFSALAGWF